VGIFNSWWHARVGLAMTSIRSTSSILSALVLCIITPLIAVSAAAAAPANQVLLSDWLDGTWSSGLISAGNAEGCHFEEVAVIKTSVVTYKRVICTSGSTKMCIIGQTARVGVDPPRWRAWCYSDYAIYLQEWELLKTSSGGTLVEIGDYNNNTSSSNQTRLGPDGQPNQPNACQTAFPSFAWLICPAGDWLSTVVDAALGLIQNALRWNYLIPSAGPEFD